MKSQANLKYTTMINPQHVHGICYLISDETHFNLSGSPTRSFFYILFCNLKKLATSVASYKKTIITIFLHVYSLNTELIIQFSKEIRISKSLCISLNAILISPCSNLTFYTCENITHSCPKTKSKLVEPSQAKTYDQKIKGRQNHV